LQYLFGHKDEKVASMASRNSIKAKKLSFLKNFEFELRFSSD